MAIVFDGKAFAEKKKIEIAKKVKSLELEGIKPSLASIYLASDVGSVLYTKLKKKAAEEVGIKFVSYEVKKKDMSLFISLVEDLNDDPSVDGVLVQKPSGSNDFSNNEWIDIVSSLDPKKDVDGLTPENLGRLMLGNPRFMPATVKAVMETIIESSVNLEGKYTVIVGASEILGKPLSMILTDKGSTVSILHKATSSISDYTTKADILISATGNPGLIGGGMVKPDSIVIDVGAPKGDVITEEVSSKVSFISPVPGGVGPVTIACLLENLLSAVN